MIPDTLKELAVPIDTLTPYQKNPRNGDLEAIKESLRANKQYRPIVVNERDNTILAGNHTYAAAMELGWQEIAATFVDASEEEAARIVLVDNRTNDLAWNDDAMVAELLKELPSIEGTGYDDDGLKELLAGIEKRERKGLVDPDAVPEPPEEPVTKRGDVWLLGRHRVMCGDSANATDMDNLTQGVVVQLVFTDPPYGVDYTGKTPKALKIANDAGGEEGTAQLLYDVFSLVCGFMEGGAAFYVCCPPGSIHRIFWNVLYECNLTVRQGLVWTKNSMVLGHSDYHYKHEPILYGWKTGRRYFTSDRTQVSVWDIDRPSRSEEHPTMKPVELVERGINNSSREGDLVLDPFAGSGSTLIAAEKTNRTCYAMELEPRYTDIICRRFQEYTGTLPVLESTGKEHDFVTQT